MTDRAAGRSYVGCSGFMYRDWKGVVYPRDLPTSSWLSWYAQRFDTVELNTSFYRLPETSSVEGWRRAVPEGFTFAVKLGAFGSHRKKLRDAETWLPRHFERFDALGATLGPTLVQLPPRWRRNVERLESFFTAAPTSMRWAVEVRDPTWLHDDVFDVLRRHGAALCVHDLLPDHPVILTADWTYVRFHGPNALEDRYRGAYGREGLAPRAAWVGEVLDGGGDAYVYFNNDYDGYAVTDAETMRTLLPS